VTSSDFLPVAVNAAEMPLPKEVTVMIPKLVAELNSKKSIIDFGEGATVKVSQFADKMLDQVSMTNIGDFQKPLTDVLVLCGTVNAQSIHNGKLNSRIPFLNRIKLMFAGVKARAVSNINSVRGQIDDITKELIKKEADLLKNLSAMEDMYQLNIQEYYALLAHTKALEQVIYARTEELAQFKLQNQNSSDPMVALEIGNRTDFLTSLDKKLYDLRAISFACLNTAPQIRNEQRSSERSIEKFRNVRSMAIPLWKKQAAIMISSLENSKTAALGKQIDDTTNQMVKDNADATAKNTVDTARMNERGVLDVETLEHANEVLINSINEMLTIAEDGKKYRADAEVKFGELKKSLNLNVVGMGMS
jgi:uncharacterized protein YaaN involved in tellurite resistance